LSYNGSSIDLHFQRENGKTTCKVTRNDMLASVRIKVHIRVIFGLAYLVALS
jgi:hypothetical protein